MQVYDKENLRKIHSRMKRSEAARESDRLYKLNAGPNACQRTQPISTQPTTIMNLGVLLFVFGLSAVVCRADEPSAPADTAADAAAAPVADGTAADADDSGKFFLFAQRSVTTAFTITTSKLEVFSTCFTGASATVCAGRRRRRLVKMDHSYPSVDGEENLVSSLSASIDDDSKVADPKEGHEKNSKYIFTLWETSTSTLVVVSTSTNAINVVSVSAICTIPGNLYPLCPP